MRVRIEDLQEGHVATVFEYDDPMWVKIKFADFTLRVSERKEGVAVIGSIGAGLAVHPRTDSTIEIVRK